MAIHDVETINSIRSALDKLPNNGSNILVYGEPWAAGALGIDTNVTPNARTDNLDMMPGVAAFNDRMREGIKGNNDGGTGYVQGNVSSSVHKVLAGVNGLFLNYSGDGVVSQDHTHTITYTTSHDNYTLWDQLINTTVAEKSPTIYSERNAVIEKKNIMAATLTLTSKGSAFILAGEEIARTKYGNHNSYNAQDKVNALDYARQTEFEKLYSWYKGLIRLRTVDFTTIASTGERAEVSETDGCIAYTFTKAVETDKYDKVKVLLNPYGNARDFHIGGTWTVIADENGFNADSKATKTGSISLPAYTTAILVQ